MFLSLLNINNKEHHPCSEEIWGFFFSFLFFSFGVWESCGVSYSTRDIQVIFAVGDWWELCVRFYCMRIS